MNLLLMSPAARPPPLSPLLLLLLLLAAAHAAAAAVTYNPALWNQVRCMHCFARRSHLAVSMHQHQHQQHLHSPRSNHQPSNADRHPTVH
jgi:hypothetical protein